MRVNTSSYGSTGEHTTDRVPGPGAFAAAGRSRRRSPRSGARSSTGYEGQPFPHARGDFQPSGENASPSIGETDHKGASEPAFNRRSKGAIPGRHVVRITIASVIRDASGKETIT